MIALVLTVLVAMAACVAHGRSRLFRLLGRTWHGVTGRDLLGRLGELDEALKSNPAGLIEPLMPVVGDWGASIATLWFFFAALG